LYVQYYKQEVIPAKAGIQERMKKVTGCRIQFGMTTSGHTGEGRYPEKNLKKYWIPAFAGMTNKTILSSRPNEVSGEISIFKNMRFLAFAKEKAWDDKGFAKMTNKRIN